MTKENNDDQRLLEDYGKGQREVMLKWIKEGTRGAQGMPLNVQVIGRPWCEELVVRVMKELEDAVCQA